MSHRWGPWPAEDPLQGEVVVDIHPRASTFGRTAVVTDRRSGLYLLKFPDGTEGWRNQLQVRRMPSKLGWRSMQENPSDEHRTEAVMALAEGAFINPLYESEWIFMDGDTPLAGVVLVQIPHERVPSRIYIAELRALSKGGGRKTMDLITKRADKIGVSLDLSPVPRRAGYYLKPMTLRKLVAWYKSFGFELQGRMRDGYMIRYPKTNP